ncbi:ATP-binding cassette domain-containing protein [Anaeromassilibacillus senegalensis]|uniref:ATP-binding cassette domain-containing protein n=2 Tax=Anaeromassilibacillus senegalensis TaxID=1673717 RepID=A0ABS9CP85_9FIRM|nr:ATP-binding cassette domain-containing protein [Anaeromassilibacillus senegalensis]
MNPIMNALMYVVVVIILAAGFVQVGSGSTTPGSIMAAITYTTQLLNLLMRFYDIDSGKISIDGQDIAQVARSSIRGDVAIVLQDTVLFSDSVRSNLLYANAEAGQAQLDEAVRMSRCGEMIFMLPQGYDTILSAAGANISQGQRQLLAIARAFVADPRILIVVMDQGRIVESGSHDDLLAQKGKYYDLYMTQYAGFAT